jgi:hypothetical protein
MTTKVSLPPMPKQSAIRRMINRWAEGQQLNLIVRLGMGHGYMIPSRTELGAYYIVFHREDDDTWACECKGFRFNKKRDSCYHVEDVIEKEREASRKWKGSKSSTKTTAKTSSSATARSGSGRKSSQKAQPTRTSRSSTSRSPAARSSKPLRKRS